MLLNFKRIIKILIMNLLYWLVEFLAILSAKNYNPNNIKKVAILFMPRLGIGDLIMLSPAIQEIVKIFPQSEINLITWVPEIIDFKNIKIMNHKEFKISRNDFDLIISPTLTLRHLPLIFLSKYWIGYFTKPKIQSNFKARQYIYDLKGEHYLWRGVRLIKALDLEIGEKMEQEAIGKSIDYPLLKFQRPLYFDENLSGINYLVIAPFAQFDERQWPLDGFAEVIDGLANLNAVNKIAILGGSSARERHFLDVLIGKLKNTSKNLIVDLVGKNDLKETCFIIKNSRLYLGLDTGPAQIAYLSASRSVVIFITVNYLNRVPLNKQEGLIRCIYPLNCPGFPFDSGLVRPSIKKSRKCAQTITPENVLSEIKGLLQ